MRTGTGHAVAALAALGLGAVGYFAAGAGAGPARWHPDQADLKRAHDAYLLIDQAEKEEREALKWYLGPEFTHAKLNASILHLEQALHALDAVSMPREMSVAYAVKGAVKLDERALRESKAGTGAHTSATHDVYDAIDQKREAAGIIWDVSNGFSELATTTGATTRTAPPTTTAATTTAATTTYVENTCKGKAANGASDTQIQLTVTCTGMAKIDRLIVQPKIDFSDGPVKAISGGPCSVDDTGNAVCNFAAPVTSVGPLTITFAAKYTGMIVIRRDTSAGFNGTVSVTGP